MEADSVARNGSDRNCDLSFFGADVLERGRVVALFKIVKSSGTGAFVNIESERLWRLGSGVGRVPAATGLPALSSLAPPSPSAV
jgi:hypothetical protein